MKIYHADRKETASLVFVNDAVLDPRPSQKVFNHSPDGFEWGYGGSGPAQLALAILLDFTGSENVAIRNYQDFKSEFIATAPQDEGFKITGDEIENWLKQRKEVKP